MRGWLLALLVGTGCLVRMDPDYPTAQECDRVRERGAPIGKERAERACHTAELQGSARASDAQSEHDQWLRDTVEERKCVAATLDLWWSYEEERGGPSLEDERAEHQRQLEMQRADRCYQLRADRPEVEYIEVPCPIRGAQGRVATAFVRAPSPKVPDGCEQYRAKALAAWTEEAP